MAQQQIQGQMQSSIAVEQNKAMLDEKQSIGEDQRKLVMQERLELAKQGNVLNPAHLENYSVLLREESEGQTDQMLQEEENMVNQEETAIRQMQQAQMQQAQMTTPEEGGMPPQGEMPEDPTMAGPAQERLQGGPTGDQIRQREFAENAPQ